MVLKLGNFGKGIRKIWKVLRFGAGKGWRSCVPIMWEMKKCYVKEDRNIPKTIKRKEEYRDWSHFAWELPSKMLKRKDRGKDGSNRNTTKKT